MHVFHVHHERKHQQAHKVPTVKIDQSNHFPS